MPLAMLAQKSRPQKRVSSFGPALCWELRPRCCRPSAARKSRLTFVKRVPYNGHTAARPPRTGWQEKRRTGLPDSERFPGGPPPRAALPRLDGSQFRREE